MSAAAAAAADEQLRKQLIQQLFDETGGAGGSGGASHDTDGPTGGGGKLLLHARVSEERESRGVKDLLKVSFQSKDDDDDDDDDDKGGAGKGKLKQRIICLSIKKGTKLRLSKVKQERFGSLSIVKYWGLDEIRSIENCEQEGQVLVNLGKIYRWTFEDLQRKNKFLETLVKLCRTHTKRMPKLINIEEEASDDAPKQDVVGREATTKSQSLAASRELDEIEADAPDAQDGEIAAAMDAMLQIDLGLVLSDFEWQANGDAAALEERLLSELQALEAANVHDIIQSETQANIVVNEIEQALSELSQIDDWLSHYTSLLDSMGQDVHQIETQNKGMQVMSTNQRLLLSSIEKLLGSLRMPGYALEVLKNEPLDDPNGVNECEMAITKLMDIIQAKFPDYGDMAAIKERKALLQGYANAFAKRLCEFLSDYFQKQAEMYMQDKSRASQKGSLKLYAHESIEQKLFKFRNLLRWLKDIDARGHHELQMTYVREIVRPYRREIQEFIEVLKTQHTQRKAAQDELDFVFVGQGVSVSSAASNAIKSAIRSGTSNLTGERSGTLSSGGGTSGGPGSTGIKQKLESWRPYRKKTARSDDASSIATGDDDEGKPSRYDLGSLKNSSIAGSMASMDLSPEERMTPDEASCVQAVGHALLKMVHIMVREQNFIIDLFSITKGVKGMGSGSLVSSAVEEEPMSPSGPMSLQSWQDDLGRPREPIKDPKAQKRVQEMMEGIFEEVREQLLATVESGLRHDQSYSVGMMVHIEFYSKEYANTSHAFVINLLESLQKRASTIFEKFVVDQIKAIEETKVTLRKRGGILPFIKTFPRFVDRMEMMLSNWDGVARKTVDKAYSRIIKSMFETLEAVAQQAGNDPKAASDEKDFLNIHILNVENMHHFYAEVRARKVPGLESSVKQAKVLYDVNMEAYCKVVIRKPLGKLLEFFEGIEGLLKTGPAEEVSFHIQYSKSALKDIIRKYPGKEVKKSLEALYKRVDKHFTEEEGLLQVVWRGIQEEFTRQLRRYEELIAKCYPEVSVRLDFTMDELLGFFSELARDH
ncbi:hypothetical protein HK105_202159 [Polyrhizophydium stewartii]|uniref:Exocyst complex component Sec3 PIP2-binding N-terminal domain-containing protein n=1 Tax=Polyrhizophydium stewartii TaxID=2732419 RepID=A0ABR4NFD1_9FUNG